MLLTRFKAIQWVFTGKTHARSFSSAAIRLSALTNIRNIGIIAHIDAGKTTTTERMLFYSGVTSRIGNVDQGDTVTDYLPQERERGITIQSAAITIPWDGKQVNLIDTPGHADFTFEVIRSLKVLDGAVTILDAVAGVESQTEKVWRQSGRLPKILFVNKMDREGAGFSRTVKEVIAKLQTRVLLVNIPLYEELANRERKFVGVIDIVHKKVLRWDAEKIQVEELDESHYEEASKSREALIETLGENDDSIIDSFLELEDYMEIPPQLIQRSIRKATLDNFAVPVLCGASFKNIGVQPLLDSISSYLPSPLESVPDIKNCDSLTLKNEEKGYIVNKNENLTVGLVFKVLNDPIRGIMNFVRVYSGKLKSNSQILVNGQKLRIGKLLKMHANVPEEVTQLSTGEIGVIINDSLKTGDTVLSNSQKKNIQPKESKISVNPMDIPHPVFSISLEPRTAGDKRHLDESLNLLLKEDPSLKVTENEETGQTLLSGMGELHLEIAQSKLVEMKSKVEIGKIMVSYKETIIEPREVVKELPNGLKLIVKVASNPNDASLLPRGKQYTNLGDLVYFINDYEPQNWDNSKVLPYTTLINALISGAISSIQRGPNLKVPLHSTTIQITEVQIPDDFNNTVELINLIRSGILEIIADSTNFQVMEPIMNVEIELGSEDMGQVIQDLTSKRNGEISSIDDNDTNNDLQIEFQKISETQYLPYDPTNKSIDESFNGLQLINAKVPLKEMIGYLPKLRSLTQGRATFNMELKGMEAVTTERFQEILQDEGF
jgi:elongation factor G